MSGDEESVKNELIATIENIVNNLKDTDLEMDQINKINRPISSVNKYIDKLRTDHELAVQNHTSQLKIPQLMGYWRGGKNSKSKRRHNKKRRITKSKK